MVLIGIGNAGCNLINEFGNQHKKICITANDFPKKCSSSEDYEEYCPKFTKKLKFNEDECWVALCGSGKVPGCTLKILETLKHKKINVIYIYPDLTLANSIQQKRNKVVFGVLQQYVRSGLLNRMYLFSNSDIINVVGDQPINILYKTLNKQIAIAIETLEWLKSETPVIGSSHESKQISRICTLSVGDFENNEEKMLFFLDNITETCYYYSVSKNQLEKNKDLLKIIKQRILKDEENNITSSFAVYPSSHNQSFFYSLKLTHFIQEK